ncbi:hypothetical protein HK097_000142 [Rhizophlyctis rosea]|uniref:CCDC174 alpha/beta GRSR domain-containing protein n=1 Tax=Rhizophlyctis rosea TaxID=64517 RepID=A0AAD5X4Q0_9FUNG|nr:hypothetical protein HK097_000142 [Rhizophlyctis rosea]
MWKKKEISVSSASVVDLKAELFKKQQELVAEKARTGSSTTKAVSLKPIKGLPPKNKNVELRGAKDAIEEVETNATLESSWVALQRKTKLYEQLRKDMGGQDDHHGEESLVDFVRKTLVDHEAGKDSDSEDDEKREQDESDDPWVEATDEFGRTRVVRKSQLQAINQQFVKAGEAGTDYDGPQLMSEDMLREAERLKWEEEMKNASATKHYNRGNEIRTLGVGHYAFSQDEEERARQQAELKQMRNQTVAQRQSAERIKDARKEKIEERRRLLKERAAKRRKVDDGAVDVKAEPGTAVEGETELDDVSLLFKDIRKRVERDE